VNSLSGSQPLNKTPVAVAIALGSGVVLSFAWPEAGIAPLAWIGLVPLMLQLHTGSLRRAFLLGTAFGVGFYGALLVWVSIVGWLGWTVLVVVQAAWAGLFALLFSVARARWGSGAALALSPFLWVAVDYLRSLFPVGGFTWGQLAQSQHDLLWLLRPAAIGGGWLVTALIVGVNALAAYVILAAAARRFRGAAVASLAAVAVIGAPALLPANEASGASLRVAIVQGNVPRNWTGTAFDKEIRILNNHVDLTRELAGEDIDLVVWPESAIGIDIERDSAVAALVSEAARAAGAPMIVGGNLDVGSDHYKVMAFLVAADGTIVDRYQKTHLVPFGEYVPARGLLDWIPALDQVPRDAIAANEPVVFDVGGGAVAPVISFEGDFGSLVRGRIDNGGRMLVIATNTSTWEESWASAQHVAFAQLRAVETGVGVLHAAVSGISAFVAPDGRVVETTELWTPETLIRDMRFADVITFYARTGDWLPLTCLIVTGVIVVAAAVARRRGPRL
jgi:apolipoprotein N-acyltransferase